MPRNVYTAEFKARIVIEVLEGARELEAIAAEHQLNPNMVRNWKAEFLQNAGRALLAISDVLGVSPNWILRNPSEMDVTVDEIAKELETCTPKEREVILHLVQTMKESIHKLKVTGDE